MIDETLAVCFRMSRNTVYRSPINRSYIKIRELFDRCAYRPVHPCAIGSCYMRPVVVGIIEYFLHDCSMSGRNVIALRIQDWVSLFIPLIIPPAYNSTKLRCISCLQPLSRCLGVPLITVTGRPSRIIAGNMFQFVKPSEGQV